MGQMIEVKGAGELKRSEDTDLLDSKIIQGQGPRMGIGRAVHTVGIIMCE